jgi:hypothetical protein
MNYSSLNNSLMIPVIEHDQSISCKVLKNTMLGILSKEFGIGIPAIIKEIKIDHDNDSWSERQWKLGRELLDITGDNGYRFMDTILKDRYIASLVIGTSKSRVVFLHERLYDLCKSLYESPESMLAYGKAISTEFSCHGLHSLNDVNLEVKSNHFRDNRFYDGLGFCSKDIFDSIGKDVLIQFRMVRSMFTHPGIAKGLLMYDPELNLPTNTILLTEGCLKGAGKSEGWNGKQDIWLGVLRNYTEPSKVKDSWTWNAIPAHKHISDSEVSIAIQKTHDLMDIATDPVKAFDKRGLLFRDKEDMSTLEQALKLAVETQDQTKLPPLTQHPYIALGIRDMVAAELRSTAVDGAVEWDYLVNTGTIKSEEDLSRAIYTNLFPVGTEVVLRRYPIILRDSWGVVVGSSRYDQSIEMSALVQMELAADQ